MEKDYFENIAEVLFNSAYAAWSMNLDIHKQAVFNDLYHPKVGDFVIETTNPFAPKLHAVGKLVEINMETGETTLLRLDGKNHIWENAKFVKVPDETTLTLMRN